MVTKQRKQDKIEETLVAMQAHLPRMETMKDIYPSEKIERLVAEVYTYVNILLREATRYYQRPAYGRICPWLSLVIYPA